MLKYTIVCCFKENRINLNYQKKLSANERLYIAFEDFNIPFCIQMVIQGKGEIDLNLFKKAVELASEKNAGSRLILAGKLNKSVWVDSKIPPPIYEVKINDESQENDLKNISFINKKIDIHKGSTCEIILVKSTNLKIIFRAFHGVMDARGVSFWAEEVFRAYRNEVLKGTTTNVTDSDFLKEFDINKAREKLPFKFKSPTGSPDMSQKGYLWLQKRIAGNYSGLVARLAVIVADESRKHFKDDIVKFMIPVDLRNHKKELLTTGNLSNPIFIEIDKNAKWLDVYQSIIQKIINKEELINGKWDYLMNYLPLKLFKKFVKNFTYWQLKNNKYMVSGIISNLGKIDLNNFETENFKPETVFFLPLDTPFTPISIVSVEHNNFIELSLSIPTALGNNNRLQKLMDSIEKNLTTENQDRFLNFNNTYFEYPKNKTIKELFEEQVLKKPDKIALIFENESLTYNELNIKANKLAQKIKTYNPQPNAVIGILSKHSFELMIGIFAIIKCGCAYLPIDPEYTSERSEYMLKDSDVKILLTNSVNSQKINFVGEILYLDNNKNYLENGENFDVNTSAENLVYVIYTSGSTGRPKGVKINQKNLINHIYWAKKIYLDYENEWSFALFSSIAFDLTVTSIFLPLIFGYQLVIYENTNILLTLKNIINDPKINIIKLTPTHLKIIKELNVEQSYIKKMILGGETLPQVLAKNIYNKFSAPDIYNEYGPTEATVGCMIYKFNPLDSAYSVPIGSPSDNVQIYILDENMNQINKPNLAGEIYISGDCLSEGYINNENLTAEKFTDNPFEKGKKMYKTGDIGRFLSDFNMEHLGRMDDQVKINGYRIEPFEIEKAISQHPNISNVVVISRDQNNNISEKYLYAYFVSTKEIEIQDLKNYLLKKIPAYMIPTFFISIEKIPLTVNGKIDKTLLPLPVFETRIKSENDAKNDDLSNQVKSILSEVLNINGAISFEESFFNLGMDSLKLISFLTKVNNDILFSKEDRLFEYFEQIVINPTIKTILDIILKVKDKYGNKV